jgi:hypothetical protein
VASLADALSLARAKMTAGHFGPKTTMRVVNGHNRCEPDGLTLIGQSGSSSDAYSLARVVASECGTLPTTYAWMICEGVINECAHAGISIFSKVTNPGAAYPLANKGWYGEQRTRWCATSKDPLEWHHEVALAVLRNPSTQLAQGARRWISCRVQDGGSQGGHDLPTDAKGIVSKWGAEGWEWIGPTFDRLTGVEVIDPYLQCMFRFVGAGKVQLGPANAMIDERRRKAFTAKNTASEGGGRHDDGSSLGPIAVAAAGAALYAATKG